MHTLAYKVGERWYQVTATNGTLQDLCMGPHVRQKQIKDAFNRLDDPDLDKAEVNELMKVDMRGPQAHGELKGVRIRWVGKPAPFSVGVAA